MNSNHLLQGVVVHAGVFIGEARLYTKQVHQIPSRKIKANEIESEIAILQSSLNCIEHEINEMLDSETLTEAERDILQTHLLILRDPEIESDLRHSIESLSYSAAAAVHFVYQKICKQFRDMHNPYLQERLADYRDVSQRIIDRILNQASQEMVQWAQTDIAVLEEISPSQVSQFSRSGLKAYCCSSGSYNSHASILSRALGLVSLVGVDNLFEHVKDKQQLILDAEQGFLICHPDQDQVRDYKQRLQCLEEHKLSLEALTGIPASTANGISIKMNVNIELPEELELVLKLKSDGIGLFRTEFLYLDRNSLPSEDEQFSVYQNLAQSLSPRPVTIRTFDLGGDKLSHLIPGKSEINPYLGSRGIRFSLSHIDLFKTQLRALLRASAFGKIQIMFPMIIDAQDFLRAKTIVLAIMEEFRAENIEFDPQIPLGAMIEIPSAALSALELAQQCDFLSIGTNDLVQYTLATDRNNDSVSAYYIQHHPAVLGLIKNCINACEEAKKPLSICGEMASIPIYVPLLIGMGIRSISLNPHQYLTIKRLINNCDERLFDLFVEFDPSQNRSKTEQLMQELMIFQQ